MAPQSFLGILIFLAIAWALSENRRAIAWRTVAAGVGLQFALGLILLRLPPSRGLFLALNRVLGMLTDATADGTSFVFGYLGGGPLPFELTSPGAEFALAFRSLPLVLVISALSALLFYWRVLPLVVNAMSKVLSRTLRIGGALGLGAAANVFVGMVESPLLVKPYLQRMSRGELFAVMTCGMATMAGTVLVLYATILSSIVPDSIGHILTASLMNAPVAIAVAAIMLPHVGETTEGKLTPPREAKSSMDAVTTGTVDGVSLLLNITAMLIVLVALVGLLNRGLGLLPDIAGSPLSLQRALGWVMAPVVWLIGIPWSEAPVAGALMGTKTVLNELIAYTDMAGLPAGTLSVRAELIMTYALCGFANFGSLGIMIGGMGTMVPDRRAEIAQLGLRSIVSGTLATLMTGAAVSIIAP